MISPTRRAGVVTDPRGGEPAGEGRELRSTGAEAADTVMGAGRNLCHAGVSSLGTAPVSCNGWGAPAGGTHPDDGQFFTCLCQAAVPVLSELSARPTRYPRLADSVDTTAAERRDSIVSLQSSVFSTTRRLLNAETALSVFSLQSSPPHDGC